MSPVLRGFSIPGYEAAAVDVFAPRIESATLLTHDVGMTPRARRFGSLEIRLEGMPPFDRPLHLRRSIGHVRLTLVAESGEATETWSRAVAPGEEAVSIETLPAGTWELAWVPSVKLFGGDHSSAPEPVRVVVEPAGAVATLPLGSTGIAEIEVVDDSGRPYEGSAAFTLWVAHGAGMSSVSFVRPPYVIPLLPPGEYRVAVTAPHPGGAQGERSATFGVHTGRTTELLLPVP